MSTSSTPFIFQLPQIHHARSPTHVLASLTPTPSLARSALMMRRASNNNKGCCYALPSHVPGSVEDVTSTLVQEIVRTSKQVPERYVQEEAIPPAVTYADDSNLVIDFSLLMSSSPEELAKLRSALTHWGCFQIINHGIASSFLDELHQVSKQFFELPVEEKLKYSVANDIYNGYGNSSVVPEDKKHSWSDRFVLTLYPEDQRKLSVWPRNPLNFSEVLNEYSLRLRGVQEEVLKAMARSLDLEEGCFLKQHGKQGRVVSRLAFYPPCPSDTAAKVYGAHPHSDTTTMSILLQDKQVESLQVLKDGQWSKVPVIPDALYINLGDFAEVMSNGIFKSVVHRVVTNSERERITVNTFFSPQEGNQIEPANALVSAQSPKLYKNVDLQTYKKLFFQSYLQGKRVIDSLKI